MSEPNEVQPAPENETRPPVDRIRSAALVFLTLGIVNSFFAIMSLGALKATAEHRAAASGLRRLLLEFPLVGTAVFAAIAVTSILIGRALVVRRPWAPQFARGFAVLQLLSIVFVQIGLFVIINFVLGFMALMNLHLAEALSKNR